MSLFRNLLAFAIAVSGFTVGSVAVNFALQVQKLSRVVEAEPESVKPGALGAKGPGTKVHLEITDFKFGEPIIEKNGEEWDCVWLPIVPPVRKVEAPAVWFRSTRIRDQASLDEFRNQNVLRVFVANTSLRKTVWGADVSQELFLKYPKLDFGKLTIVTEPGFAVPCSRQLAGSPKVLSGSFLLSRQTELTAWAVGCGSLLLGMIVVALIITPIHQQTIREATCTQNKNDTGTAVVASYRSTIPARLTTPDDTAKMRELLLNEHPVTTHQFRAIGTVSSILVSSLALLVFLGIFAAVLYGSTQAKANGPATAGLIGLFAAAVFMFFIYFTKRSMDMKAKAVDVIQLCTNGVRWQRGKKVAMAAWCEIALVERVTVDVNVKKQAMAAQFGLVGALAASMGSAGDDAQLKRQRDSVCVQFQNGEVMFFAEDTLSDYVTFATTIHEAHGNEARRFQTGGDRGPIARALVMPGGPSNFSMQNYRPVAK